MEKQTTIEDRIEEVLDKIRPFLLREGGNITLDHFDSDTGICYVDMIGACQGCIMAASDVSDTISLMVLDEVPEVKNVELISPKSSNSVEDLIERLRQEELANLEFEEMKKNKKNDE